jgi:phage terminase large subunit-like protein
MRSSRDAVAAPPTHEAGAAVADFIEQFCRISKGDSAGQPVRLQPWQRQLLTDTFAQDRYGRRRHRTALWGLPRKNSKSFLGSGVALYLLVADGEPGAEVYSCAGDRQQARIVFGEAKRMVDADEDLSSILTIYRDAIEYKRTQSVYRVLSADAKLQQGLNPSACIFDEVHVQPNDELWNAMVLGMGTRSQPLMLGITTAGFDRDSLLYRLYEYGRRVRSGEIDDPTFFFRWWEPSDPNCDWLDERVWAEANPALGTFLRMEALRADARTTPEHEFRRYHLNQWTTTRHAWLPHGAWEACADPGKAVEDGSTIVLGFDGAWSNDSTALVGCTVEEIPHLFVIDVWEKPLDNASWRVDMAEVEEAIILACQRYRVARIVCDPYRWQKELQILSGMGLPVLEFPTNSLARMVPACQQFFTAVTEWKLSHDGDPRLARHIANAVTKSDRFGTRIVKESASSPRKIDLAVASVIALDGAYRELSAVQSVYETDGLLIIG